MLRHVFQLSPDEIDALPLDVYSDYIEWAHKHLEALYQRGGQ